MDRNRFTLLKGGLDDKQTSKMSYICGHVTDTRLMGVLYLYMRWFSDDGVNLHMFFYLDAEETGFETYRSLKGDDMSAVDDIEMEMAGGLGGAMIDLNENEARALLQEYAGFNSMKGIPLPAGRDEYEFLLEPVELTPREKKILLSKQCTRIKSEFQLVHYFLMRCFGHDFEIAKMMTSGDVKTDIYDHLKRASYYRNSITDSGKGTYLCESLVESKNQYHIIVSEIAIRDGRVIYFENCSDLEISSQEAAMILARSEYINCYEILIDPDTAESLVREIARNSMLTRHEDGSMYMMFNTNNDHVDGPVFQMNEDVYGVYYITKYGQLIASSYNEDTIMAMHEDIKNCGLSRGLMVAGKYIFTEPVLYDFVTSGFDDFEEFVSFLSE